MRFAHILQTFYCSPWLILPGAHLSMAPLLAQLLAQGKILSADRGKDLTTYPQEDLPQMEIFGGCAVIPVQGTLVRGATQLEKSCGITDVEDVMRDIKEAMDDPDVSNILLNVDSPGGMANGSYELSLLVSEANARKEVTTWCPGTLGSAALMAAAGSTQIITAPSARSGSIGSYCCVLDSSRAYEMAGYKMQLFASGPLKGAGVDGTALSQDQIAFFQDQANKSAEMFKAHLRATRPQIQEADMNGAFWHAAEAFDKGVIDGTANCLDDLIEMLR